MILRKVGDFQLDAIYASGQAFTWRRLQTAGPGTGYLVASGRQRCRLGQSGDTLAILDADGRDPSPAQKAYWLHYLALDQDYGHILQQLDIPAEVREASRGIRVLAQDWWDALVSFVVSQNSNIPRIQHTMDALMEAGGGLVPRPDALATLLANEGLAASLRLGYRLPYLRGVAERCLDWQPHCLTETDVPLDEERAELQTLPGVGPKVANCVCLFGLGYLSAVPRDTWIKKVEAREHVVWDTEFGGIQQQYWFAWAREREA